MHSKIAGGCVSCTGGVWTLFFAQLPASPVTRVTAWDSESDVCTIATDQQFVLFIFPLAGRLRCYCLFSRWAAVIRDRNRMRFSLKRFLCAGRDWHMVFESRSVATINPLVRISVCNLENCFLLLKHKRVCSHVCSTLIRTLISWEHHIFGRKHFGFWASCRRLLPNLKSSYRYRLQNRPRPRLWAPSKIKINKPYAPTLWKHFLRSNHFGHFWICLCGLVVFMHHLDMPAAQLEPWISGGWEAHQQAGGSQHERWKGIDLDMVRYSMYGMVSPNNLQNPSWDSTFDPNPYYGNGLDLAHCHGVCCQGWTHRNPLGWQSRVA